MLFKEYPFWLTSVNEIFLEANMNYLENNLQLYLYGDPSINNLDNKNILLSTIEFIKETQRFSTSVLSPPPPPPPPLRP